MLRPQRELGQCAFGSGPLTLLLTFPGHNLDLQPKDRVFLGSLDISTFVRTDVF